MNFSYDVPALIDLKVNGKLIMGQDGGNVNLLPGLNTYVADINLMEKAVLSFSNLNISLNNSKNSQVVEIQNCSQVY